MCHGLLYVAMEERTYTVLPGSLSFCLPASTTNATEADPTTKLIGIHFDFFGELNINREEDMVILEEGVVQGKIAVEAVGSELLSVVGRAGISPFPRLCAIHGKADPRIYDASAKLPAGM